MFWHLQLAKSFLLKRAKSARKHFCFFARLMCASRIFNKRKHVLAKALLPKAALLDWSAPGLRQIFCNVETVVHWCNDSNIICGKMTSYGHDDIPWLSLQIQNTISFQLRKGKFQHSVLNPPCNYHLPCKVLLITLHCSHFECSNTERHTFSSWMLKSWWTVRYTVRLEIDCTKQGESMHAFCQIYM